MPKSKAEMNKALRDRRIKAGIVEARVWVKPEDRQLISNVAGFLNGDEMDMEAISQMSELMLRISFE